MLKSTNVIPQSFLTSLGIYEKNNKNTQPSKHRVVGSQVPPMEISKSILKRIGGTAVATRRPETDY